MKCKNCNFELAAGINFCPKCGHKIDGETLAEMWKELKTSEMEAALQAEQAKQEAEIWNEKRNVNLKKKKKLCLKLDNFRMIMSGEYPGIKKNEIHRSIGKYDEIKVKILFAIELVLAALSLLNICMKWFDINYISMVANIEFPSRRPLGNLHYLIKAAFKLSDSKYFDDLVLPIFSMIALCVLVCAMILFLGKGLCMVIMQKEKERIWRSFRLGFVCGGLASMGTYVVAFIPWNARWFIGSNRTMEYVYPEKGAAYALALSLLGLLLCFLVKKAEGDFAENDLSVTRTEREGQIDRKKITLEIMNYNPSLLFRPIRIHISNEFGVKMCLELRDYDYPEIDFITAELHLFKTDGKRVILPNITFVKNKKDDLMYGGVINFKLDNINNLKEAQIFIKEYSSDFCKYSGNNWYGDSDYSVEELNNIRQKNEYPIFVKVAGCGDNVRCSCGQMYKKELAECPLCGRKNNEMEKVDLDRTISIMREKEKNITQTTIEENQKPLNGKFKGNWKQLGIVSVCVVLFFISVSVLAHLMDFVFTPVKNRFDIVGEWKKSGIDPLETLPDGYEFYSNGMGEADGYPISYEIKSGNILIVEYQNSGYSFEYEYKLNGDFLDIIEEDCLQYYVREK